MFSFFSLLILNLKLILKTYNTINFKQFIVDTIVSNYKIQTWIVF
jgi:hypothetical protein